MYRVRILEQGVVKMNIEVHGGFSVADDLGVQAFRRKTVDQVVCVQRLCPYHGWHGAYACCPHCEQRDRLWS